jgi:hypothetical protein
MSLKFLYWINATIFLSLMGRRLSSAFWKFSSLEVISATIAATSFSFSLVYRDAVYSPLLFALSSLIYLVYMAKRVWNLSEWTGEP